jgi:NAD+ diphosphatase
LDRAAHLRKDDAWLAAALQDESSLFLPIWQSRSLINPQTASFSAVMLSRGHHLYESLAVTPNPADFVFLGRFREQACFAWTLDVEQPPAIEAAEFQDLRTIIAQLPRDEAGLLAYARALIGWRDRHRYCSRCGSPAAAKQGGHVMRCTSEPCGAETFPRIDPAIIVLVTDGERALLGRQAAWRPGWYSTIAGFVEAGESLEDAVAREVLEETGVHVERIAYHSSQPWPFPQSLMLGFIAHATTTEIDSSDDELEDVRWFTRADIASGMPMTPPPISISGCLIEDWYDAEAARPLREEPAARTWNTRGGR